MPNWSEGVLKVRGAKEDIENFIRNGIDYNDYSHKLENGELKTEPKPRECPIEIDEDEIRVKNTMDLWVKGTRRMFVNSKDIYAYFSKNKVKPSVDWVNNLVKQADAAGVQVFMKESLRPIMGADFRQDPLPWQQHGGGE